jgi:DNA modification methylase
LLYITSQYGEFTENGFAEFVFDTDFSIDDIRLTDGEFDISLYDNNQDVETEGDDEVPEEVWPVTKLGDLWELGDHRLLCEDSTDSETVSILMNGQKADMVFTDPPYNIDYEGNYIQSGEILKKEKKIWSGGIENDNLTNFGEWLKSVYNSIDQFMSNGCSIYIWHSSGEGGKHFWNAWPFKDWHFQVDLIWNKLSLIISRWDYKPQHEPCMYGWKGKNRKWGGPNNFSTVWDYPRQQGNSGEDRKHPNQKPIFLTERAIDAHRPFLTFDPFLGSGSTLIACEKKNTKCYGMELDPHYCDVIVNRYKTWCLANGKTPVIKLNGEHFDISIVPKCPNE